ncbi:MAG: cbb3-type cytochrome c oxidase subunit I [Euryarchaeota archaeon]|nr:cbb3-type cytochrome c oxidase subunit I [Euryarchaeota archaeon]
MAYPTVVKVREEAALEARTWREVAYHWMTTTNHKEIGILYIVFSFTFFVLAGLLAMFIRAELATPGPTILDESRYAQFFSTHGTSMIFLFIIPVFVGFANYFVPPLIGAKDMAFPRINALGFWMLLPAAAMIWIGQADVGWTGYAPLTNRIYTPGSGVDLWLAGLIMVGTSSILGGVNFLVTIFKLRRPGLTFWKMPLFVWAMMATSVMVVMATPVLAGALTLAFLDRNIGTCFFLTTGACAAHSPGNPGDPILWQHLFWFYSHPAVYIMVLPAMGVVNEVIPKMVRKPLYGYKAMALALFGIALIGFLVWVHHMFTTGLSLTARAPFMFATMAVAIPTGVKIFNWLATIWRGSINFRTPLLFAVGFIALFTIGGITGVYQASIPVDYKLQESYWVVAHLHYVLFGGSVMGLFAAAYFWFPTITGRMYNERLGQIHFLATLVGMNLTFFPMHFIGLSGMLRRTFDYTNEIAFWPELGPLNLLSSIGAFLLGASQLIFFYNVIVSRYKGKPAPADPWA